MMRAKGRIIYTVFVRATPGVVQRPPQPCIRYTLFTTLSGVSDAVTREVSTVAITPKPPPHKRQC